jgi:hypothetical protein
LSVVVVSILSVQRKQIEETPKRDKQNNSDSDRSVVEFYNNEKEQVVL